MELNQQIAALLSAGDEEDLMELKGLQQQLSDVCYRQASQLEFRQNVLQSAHEFHMTAQDVRYDQMISLDLHGIYTHRIAIKALQIFHRTQTYCACRYM